MIAIQSKEIKSTATTLKLRVKQFEVGAKEISVFYRLLSDAGEDVSSGDLTLTGDDLAKWGNDDNYLYDWACTQLGLTK